VGSAARAEASVGVEDVSAGGTGHDGASAHEQDADAQR
jgi:hypothetical protein